VISNRFSSEAGIVTFLLHIRIIMAAVSTKAARSLCHSLHNALSAEDVHVDKKKDPDLA
jgi:hypothetical protein